MHMTLAVESKMDTGFYRKDGLYSWIVLAAIVLNSAVCMGFLFATSGILVVDYATLLQIENSQATLVGSFLLGVCLFSMPFNTLLVKCFGCRWMSIIAFILTILGYVSSAFATELWHLIAGFSVLTGFGGSLNKISTIAIIPDYFDHRKNMAYMATAIGSGMAFAIYPVVYSAIREVHDYRTTILYLLPLICCSVSAPIIFKDQSERLKFSSVNEILRSYTTIFRRFITPFYFVNVFLWNSTHVGVVVLLYSYASLAVSEDVAAQVQTIMGIMSVVGSVIFTLILSKVKLNQYILHISCNIAAGSACFVLAAYPEKYTLFIMAGIIGMFYSVTIGNMVCVCSHLYSPTEVEYAYGLQEAIGGVAGFLGPYTAAVIQDKYGREAGMWYLGAQILLGASVLALVSVFKHPIIKPYDTHQQSHDEQLEEDQPVPGKLPAMSPELLETKS